MSIRRGIVVVLVAATTVLVGCRNDAPQTQEGESGVKFDVGVTKEPCPAAIDKAKGCIYLGSISDLTEGPFKALGVPITESQKAFWKRVNEAGGIGAYEVDATKYVKDNKYNPQIHNEVYAEIKPDVLGLAQTLGSPTTAAILADLEVQQHDRRTGVVDLGLGVRGRDPGVGHELLLRIDELGRFRGRDAEVQDRRRSALPG